MLTFPEVLACPATTKTTITGNQAGFQASQVQGGIFALLALIDSKADG